MMAWVGDVASVPAAAKVIIFPENTKSTKNQDILQMRLPGASTDKPTFSHKWQKNPLMAKCRLLIRIFGYGNCQGSKSWSAFTNSGISEECWFLMTPFEVTITVEIYFRGEMY